MTGWYNRAWPWATRQARGVREACHGLGFPFELYEICLQVPRCQENVAVLMGSDHNGKDTFQGIPALLS